MKRALALAAALAVAACSGGTAKPVPIVPVALSLVPAKLTAENLTLQLDTTAEFAQAVASLGKQLLVTDARLWEIHLSSRLVGAVQLAMLKPRINPAKAADRNTIINQILGALPLEIDLNGLPVWTTPNDGSDRAIFIWFGAHSFGVLQLKGDGIKPGAVADDLIGRIASQPAWQALPPQVYEKA